MSSIKYSTELVPDPGLRRLVLITGLLATGAGIVILAALPLAGHWRLLAGLIWCLWHGRDLWHIAMGNKAYERMQVDEEGNVRLFDAEGCCAVATIETGSVVLPRFAWLRFRTDAGWRHVELLRRRSARNNDWRRLQVIWRHLGAHG